MSTDDIRCYLLPQLLDRLQMKESTFFAQKKRGRLPFVEELRPRIGRCARFRADLVDKYLSGNWPREIPRTVAAFGRRRR